MDLIIQLFAENVWPLIWLIGLVILVLAIAIQATGRGRLVVGIVALVVLALGLLALESLLVTDRERVDGVIDRVAEAVRAERADELVQFLAPRCRYGNLDQVAIERLAARVFNTYEIQRVTLNGRKTKVSRLRQEATAEFVAVIRARQGTTEFAPYPTRWQFTLKPSDGGDWQIVEIQQLPTVGDSRNPISPPLNPQIP